MLNAAEIEPSLTELLCDFLASGFGSLVEGHVLSRRVSCVLMVRIVINERGIHTILQPDIRYSCCEKAFPRTSAKCKNTPEWLSHPESKYFQLDLLPSKILRYRSLLSEAM